MRSQSTRKSLTVKQFIFNILQLYIGKFKSKIQNDTRIKTLFKL